MKQLNLQINHSVERLLAKGEALFQSLSFADSYQLMKKFKEMPQTLSHHHQR